MTLITVSKKMRFPASAGDSSCEVMNLLVLILFSARFCFLVINMLDLQYLRKSEKTGYWLLICKP